MERKVIKRLSIERPEKLPCEIHWIKTEKNKWVVFLGFEEEMLFEVFCGKVVDDFPIHHKVKSGEIIKEKDNYGCNKYDFRYKDRYGHYVVTESVNSLTEEYYNENVNVSFMLRYLPNSHVLKVIKKWKVAGDLLEFQQVLIEVIQKYISEK